MNAPKTSSYKSDLAVVAVIGVVWLVPWFLITWAAKLAGGGPTASPFGFISNIFSYFGGTKHGSMWGVFVGTQHPINMFFFWMFMILIVVIVGGGAFFAAMYWKGGLPAGLGRYFAPSGLRKNSRWATWYDLRALRVTRPRQGSFILGRRGTSLIATEKETSLLVIGPTRSGKTTGLVIPNLFEWDGPAIVTSTKSELVDITGGYRQGVGPVYVYDPTGEISDRYQSVTWSPITGCQTLDYAWMVASWLTAGLQPASGGKSDNDWAHWAESGKLLIAPLLYVAASTGQHSIIDVRGWIQGYDLQTPMAILQDMLDEEEQPENSDPERAISMLMSIDQRPEKERGTVFSTVTRIFSVFNEKPVAESAMTSRFNPDEFLRRKGTLYLCTPSQTPERVASLFVGILMTVVTRGYLMANHMPRGRLVPELGLFLDELANVVPIEELPSVASQGAGRGVIIMSIVQDLSQLRARYGPDKSNSIINNHGAKMVLPGISDPETTELVAKLVGREQYTDVSVSQNDGKTNKTFAVRQDQMATPDALRQLQAGTAIVLYRGMSPTIVRLRPWYLEKRFVELSQRKFFRNAEYVSYERAS